MAPTVFISSTIEDLHHVRDAIRETVSELGYQPIMSEHGGVGYMNETAADVACYQTVKECQLMILIIGKKKKKKTHDSGLVSVTEHEYDTCMEHKPRLITFVDGEVLNYKRVFDCSPNAKDVNYPGMDNANATFEFINKVMHSPVRNAIIPFSSVSDVRSQLKQQLAALFHDLLDEHANPAKSALDEIMVEVKTIRNALSKKSTPDMRFLTVFKFLLDDQNQDFRQFLKVTIADIENVIPRIYEANDFDAFASKADIAIEIVEAQDCFTAFKDKRNLIQGASFFPVRFFIGTRNEKPLPCSYATDSDGNVFMNAPAHEFFVKVYADLKKRLSMIGDDAAQTSDTCTALDNMPNSSSPNPNRSSSNP